MNLLRAGDVVTYCFRVGDWSIVADGRVRTEVRDARGRCLPVGQHLSRFIGILEEVFNHEQMSFVFQWAIRSSAARQLANGLTSAARLRRWFWTDLCDVEFP